MANSLRERRSFGVNFETRDSTTVADNLDREMMNETDLLLQVDLAVKTRRAFGYGRVSVESAEQNQPLLRILQNHFAVSEISEVLEQQIGQNVWK